MQNPKTNLIPKGKMRFNMIIDLWLDFDEGEIKRDLESGQMTVEGLCTALIKDAVPKFQKSIPGAQVRARATCREIK